MLFLDPTNDYAFKRIFGNENKKEILISFLNSILRFHDQERIKDVTILNPNQALHLKGAKETILDVRCKDQAGSEYIVEMQVLSQAFFDKRVLYYASKAYSNQLDSAMQYHELKPVIFIGILNFEFTKNSHYISTHILHDVETREHILTDFRFTFVELPKFLKKEEELTTIEDKWIYFLKHAKELNIIPKVLKEPELKAAFEVINKLNWSKDELDYYDKRAMYIQDEIQRVNYSFQKGMTQGIEKGIEQGIEKGIEQGIEQGMKKGENSKAITIAQAMLQKGMEIDSIIEVTGINREEIEALLNSKVRS